METKYQLIEFEGKWYWQHIKADKLIIRVFI